jgi:small subunit ribosomal protein S16
MAVHIRLRRIGKNPSKKVFFRIAVFDERQARDARVIEDLGYYDPTKNPAGVKVNKDRLAYWLSKGAQASDTVKSIAKKVKI